MPRLIAMLPVHNEADRRLIDVLDQLSAIVDAIVIYDDASTDATPEICRRHPKVHYYRGDVPWFPRNEAQMRRHLWDLTVLYEPDWVLALDADEVFEPAGIPLIPRLTDQSDYDAVAFRIFDLWKSTRYVRNDGAWNPWNRFTPLLVRFDPTLSASWTPQAIHCGRFPAAYQDRVMFQSSVRVQHYGWVDPETHAQKYLFYRERDLAVYGVVREHTESIESPSATVEPWLDLPVPDWLAAPPPSRR